MLGLQIVFTECTEFNSKGSVFRVQKARMGSLVAPSVCALMCESLEGGTIDNAPKRVLSCSHYYFKTQLSVAECKHSNWATSDRQKRQRIHNRAVSLYLHRLQVHRVIRECESFPEWTEINKVSWNDSAASCTHVRKENFIVFGFSFLFLLQNRIQPWGNLPEGVSSSSWTVLKDKQHKEKRSANTTYVCNQNLLPSQRSCSYCPCPPQRAPHLNKKHRACRQTSLRTSDAVGQ